MNLTNNESLARGAMVVDFAFSDGGRHLRLAVPEYIGVVGACLNRGILPDAMERELTSRVNSEVGQRAKATFDYFNAEGGALWEQGPAYDHIDLLDRRLLTMFPKVRSHFGFDF